MRRSRWRPAARSRCRSHRARPGSLRASRCDASDRLPVAGSARVPRPGRPGRRSPGARRRSRTRSRRRSRSSTRGEEAPGSEVGWPRAGPRSRWARHWRGILPPRDATEGGRSSRRRWRSAPRPARPPRTSNLKSVRGRMIAPADCTRCGSPWTTGRLAAECSLRVVAVHLAWRTIQARCCWLPRRSLAKITALGLSNSADRASDRRPAARRLSSEVHFAAP